MQKFSFPLLFFYLLLRTGTVVALKYVLPVFKLRSEIIRGNNSIPQKNTDKTTQPFFTTKPTCHAIGLSLSLSYDIIKAHSGELKVNSKEGEYAEFVIQLPKVTQ